MRRAAAIAISLLLPLGAFAEDDGTVDLENADVGSTRTLNAVDVGQTDDLEEADKGQTRSLDSYDGTGESRARREVIEAAADGECRAGEDGRVELLEQTLLEMRRNRQRSHRETHVAIVELTAFCFGLEPLHGVFRTG